MHWSKDLIALAWEFWRRRIVLLVVFLGVAAGGASYFLSRPRVFRAETYLDSSLPAEYQQMTASSKRLLGMTGILRSAYQRHAGALADPEWAETTLSAQLGPEAAVMAKTVRARLIRSDTPGLFRLQVSLQGTDASLVSRAVDSLARAYVAEHSLWEQPEVDTALKALNGRLAQLKAELADTEKEFHTARVEETDGPDPYVFLLLSSRAMWAQTASEQAASELHRVSVEIATLLRDAGCESESAGALAGSIKNAPLPDALEAQAVAWTAEQFDLARRALGNDGRPAARVANTPDASDNPLVRQRLRELLGASCAADPDLGELASLWSEARMMEAQLALYQKASRDYQQRLLEGILAQQNLSDLLERRMQLVSDRSELRRVQAQLVWTREHGEAGATLWVSPSLRPTTTVVNRSASREAAYALITAALVSLGLGIALVAVSPPVSGGMVN